MQACPALPSLSDTHMLTWERTLKGWNLVKAKTEPNAQTASNTLLT